MTDKKGQRLVLVKRNDVADNSIEAYTRCACVCNCTVYCNRDPIVSSITVSGVNTSEQSMRLFI